MEARNHGGRKQTGSSSCAVSSSSSGTISTTCTSTGSRVSSISMLEAAMHFDFDVHVDENVSREAMEEGQMKHIQGLVQEFFAAPSANCGIEGGDMRVLEKWFLELGVGWVLHLPLVDGTPAPAAASVKLEHSTLDARSWIRALVRIVETIRSTTLLFPDCGSMGLPVICEAEQLKAAVPDQFLLRRVTKKLLRRVTNRLFQIKFEEETESGRGKQASCIPDQVQFAQFFRETMLKMLAFVDFVATDDEVVVSNGVQEQPYEKLSILLGVRGALSKAIPQIRLSSYSPPNAQVSMIQCDVVSLLAAKEGKVAESIWSTMQQIWKRISEEYGNNSSDTRTPQGSSDIHKATRSVIRYIGFIRANYPSVAPIVSGAASLGKYVPQNEDMRPLDSMIIEMASCLDEKLGLISQSFPNHSLGFLFLANNLYYLIEQLRPMNSLSFKIPVLTCKINNYIEYYLQVSWTPMLLCLYISHTPAFQWRRYSSSPLPKFDSEFLKTYQAQKFWKVPDPDMRKILRRAVTEKVVSVFTKYLADTDTARSVRSSSFTPQELKEMLQDLFEG